MKHHLLFFILSRFFVFFLLVQAFSLRALPLEFEENTILRDAETELLLQDIVRPILKVAQIPQKDISLYLFASLQVNAFASVGKLLVVYSGLIFKCPDASALAGVLAHEIAHIEKRDWVHSRDALDKASHIAILGLLIGGVLGATTKQAEGVLAGVAGGQQAAERTFLKFSRSTESTADQRAIDYLKALKWPLSGFEALMNLFAKQEFTPSIQQDPYARTHPVSRERALIIQKAAQHVQGALPKDFEERFQTVRLKLLAYLQPQQARKALSKETRPLLKTYITSILLYRQGHLDQALAKTEILIKQGPSNPHYHDLRATLFLEKKQFKKALHAIEQAILHAPLPLFTMLKTQILLEASAPPSELEKMLVPLQDAQKKELNNPDPWRLMAIIYGKKGDKAQMHLALAEKELLLGQEENAKRHALRAQALLSKGISAHQRAVDLVHALRDPS